MKSLEVISDKFAVVEFTSVTSRGSATVENNSRMSGDVQPYKSRVMYYGGLFFRVLCRWVESKFYERAESLLTFNKDS